MSILKKDKITDDLVFNYVKLGPLTAWRDSFTFKLTDKIFWNVNYSWPGIGTDNLLGARNLKRLEFTIWPFGHWLIGLAKGSGAQSWTFREGYRSQPRKWGRICWSPPKSLICKNLTGETNGSYCGAFRWHECPYIAE